jgi:hypothetical protein
MPKDQLFMNTRAFPLFANQHSVLDVHHGFPSRLRRDVSKNSIVGDPLAKDYDVSLEPELQALKDRRQIVRQRED